MKLSNVAPFFLAATGFLSSTAKGMRDLTKTKKTTRQLEWEECEVWVVNHTVARSITEINVTLEEYPSEGHGLFKIKFEDPPYGTPDDPVETFGWCVDYDRELYGGVLSVDVFSAFDKTIHPDAVDKHDMFPNLAYLINTRNVGDTWPKSDTCEGGPIRWGELQGAVWMIIDDKNGTGVPRWDKDRITCISEELAEDARVNGNKYELNCSNPNEQVPLVLVIDDVNNIVLNQTIITETNVHTIEGLCECCDDKTPPTQAPVKTPAPTVSPTIAPSSAPTSAPTRGSSSGDPHFKTWVGAKFDYHGECDLVLLDHPSFNDGQGLRVHVRTTRVKYFSFIETVAIQIGDETLEFNNDVDNFLINGAKVEAKRKHHDTLLAGFIVRRDHMAISIRLHGDRDHRDAIAKIDLVARRNGFPAVIVNAGNTDIFKGSLGLLGDWPTGQTLARDGKTVIPVSKYEATDFALEWQVRDNEPMLFQESRFPQFPTTCTPPDKMPQENRLGAARLKKEAEEACAHWKHDKEDCIFDVMATRDVLVAHEGHFVNIE